MNKRLDLLEKYFADLSKIFSAVVVKQFIGDGFNALEVILGSLATFGFLIAALIIQPKE